jgi:receptor expression-enhancing protein 5/6
MPLVVPVLRACMLFQNVWETFKILKPPPPSRRNEGRPSVRAASQRKRDMKGAMTIWIVWVGIPYRPSRGLRRADVHLLQCCFATYERSLDSYVRIFIPFYDEIKS